MKIQIYIESTLKRAKSDGVVVWLVEYLKDDTPITRQGFVHVENNTDAAGCLMGLINAFTILKKPCEVKIFTECETVYNTMSNSWQVQWKKNSWQNAKGKEVRNRELWEMLDSKMQAHTYSITDEPNEYRTYLKNLAEKELRGWKE